MGDALLSNLELLGNDKLIIGFDYWNTATQNPPLFAAIARCVRMLGGKVYIITAVGQKRASTNIDEVEALGVPNDGIYQVVFDKPQEAPKLKADMCVKLGIDMFFDDRHDICEAIRARGIIACNVLKEARREN